MSSSFKANSLKIFFVVTLESGRVKPDDVTTMELVLKAARQIKTNTFSIIINKMSKGVAQMLEDEEKREELAVCLAPPSIGITTNSIFYVPLNPTLEDKTDEWSPLDPEVLDFISKAPAVLIEKVKDLRADTYEDVLVKLRAELDQLKADKERMRKAIKRRQKKLGKTAWYTPPPPTFLLI